MSGGLFFSLHQMKSRDFAAIVGMIELSPFISGDEFPDGARYIPSQRWIGEKSLTYKEFPWWVKINNDSFRGYWAILSELLYEQCTTNLYYGDNFRNFRNQW